ncbi:MAG: hypothetical protein Q9195_007517 [Heterodermia aff. obscurata]
MVTSQLITIPGSSTPKLIPHSLVHGPDPTSNPRLAPLITAAKKSGLPKSSIDGAIARAAGKSLSGAALEHLTIEAMLPPSVAAIIECQTDNRLRTLADIRFLVKEFGGTVTPTEHLFERMGRVVVHCEVGMSAEDMFDVAIEAGATDVEEGDVGEFVLTTEPQETAAVAERMGKVDGLRVLSSEIVWAPKEEWRVEEGRSEILGDFVVDKLEEDASVQNVYLNEYEIVWRMVTWRRMPLFFEPLTDEK